MFKRALKDTLSGQVTAVIVLVAGGGLSLAYLYFTESPKMAAEESTYFFAAVFGAFGALFLLFLWNLACAPYRIANDTLVKSKKECEELREMIKRPKPRHLNEEQKSILTDAIRACRVSPSITSVIYDPATLESRDFASDIVDALQSANFKVRFHDGAQLERNPRDRGLKLYVGKGKTIQKLGDAVFNAFRDVGFYPERRRANTDDNFFISVFPQSEAD